MASRNPLVSNQYTTVFVASQPIADMLIHFEIHHFLIEWHVVVSFGGMYQ